MTRGQFDESIAMGKQERCPGANNEAAVRLARECAESLLDLNAGR